MRMATRLPTTANPFRTPPIKYSGWYLCKTAVVGVTLFPIRLAVLATALALGGLCGALATIGTNPRSPRPPSPGRRLLVQPIRLFARAFLWALGYWHITVEYQPGSAPHRSRVLVVAPHYSLLDPIVMNWLELPCSVAKAAVAKMPVVGKVAVALQTIFVDRKDPDSKHKCVAAIKERATDAAWPPLLVFPEGTCTNGDVLISFKPGAFLPGVTVQARPSAGPRRCRFHHLLLHHRLRLPLRSPSCCATPSSTSASPAPTPPPSGVCSSRSSPCTTGCT